MICGMTKEISEDAVKAKQIGVSYGKYKAGIRPDNEDTGYQVSSMDYIRATETKNDVKPKAFIKIK